MSGAAPIRTLIADDEPPARDRIRELLRARPDFELVGECGTGRETLERIRAERPDLVFLDIQMPLLGGFDVVRALAPEEMPLVVFVTAYDEYAVRAFEVHALDYLLKPFDDRRFDDALRRVRARLGSRELLDDFARRVGRILEGDAEAPLRRIVAKDGDRSVLVPVERVDWIEAANHYVVLHAGAETHLLDEPLGRLERRLDERFARIHRSTIVNLDRVAEFQRLFHGDFAVVLRDGTELKLSRTYRGALEERLGRSL